MILKGFLRRHRGSFALAWMKDFGLFKLEQNLNDFHFYGCSGGRFLDFLPSWMPSALSEYKLGAFRALLSCLSDIWKVFREAETQFRWKGFRQKFLQHFQLPEPVWTATDRSPLHCLCATWARHDSSGMVPVQKTFTNAETVLCISC